MLQLCISEGLQGGKAEINTGRQQEHRDTAEVDLRSSPTAGGEAGEMENHEVV